MVQTREHLSPGCPYTLYDSTTGGSSAGRGFRATAQNMPHATSVGYGGHPFSYVHDVVSGCTTCSKEALFS